MPTFRAEASARTWLLAIARKTCMDELRTRTRRRRRDAALVASSAGRPDLTNDAGHQAGVDDMLARLAPERKEAFVLTQLLGLSYDEAAQVCDCPSGTIRSRVARAGRTYSTPCPTPARPATATRGSAASTPSPGI